MSSVLHGVLYFGNCTVRLEGGTVEQEARCCVFNTTLPCRPPLHLGGGCPLIWWDWFGSPSRMPCALLPVMTKCIRRRMTRVSAYWNALIGMLTLECSHVVTHANLLPQLTLECLLLSVLTVNDPPAVQRGLLNKGSMLPRLYGYITVAESSDPNDQFASKSTSLLKTPSAGS